MFQVRKDKFKDHLAVMESLELVEEDDQFTHMIALDDATNAEDMLSMLMILCSTLSLNDSSVSNGLCRISDVFKEDPEFLANEEKYKELKNEIIDSSDSEDEGSGSGSDADSSDSDGRGTTICRGYVI